MKVEGRRDRDSLGTLRKPFDAPRLLALDVVGAVQQNGVCCSMHRLT